jgi:diadenylate cyclase
MKLFPSLLLEILDIAIVTLILYQIFKRFRGSPVAQGFLAILFVLLIYIVSQWASLSTTQWIMNHFLQNVFLILIILFQPEFRRLLSQFSFRRWLPGEGIRRGLITTIEEILKAVSHLQQERVGSLIIIERTTTLGSVIETGNRLDALVSAPLLVALFQRTSPLHDGAVIIAQDRILSAGCFLPIDSETHLPAELGTRHRAAMGISKESDAIVIVTSEEQGTISLVHDGALIFDLSIVELRSRLQVLLKMKLKAQ